MFHFERFHFQNHMFSDVFRNEIWEMFQNNWRIGLIWFNLFEYAQSNVCFFCNPRKCCWLMSAHKNLVLILVSQISLHFQLTLCKKSILNSIYWHILVYFSCREMRVRGGRLHLERNPSNLQSCPILRNINHQHSFTSLPNRPCTHAHINEPF